jgi:hypothetical protein
MTVGRCSRTTAAISATAGGCARDIAGPPCPARVRRDRRAWSRASDTGRPRRALLGRSSDSLPDRTAGPESRLSYQRSRTRERRHPRRGCSVSPAIRKPDSGDRRASRGRYERDTWTARDASSGRPASVSRRAIVARPAPAPVERQQRLTDCSYPCDWALPRVGRSGQGAAPSSGGASARARAKRPRLWRCGGWRTGPARAAGSGRYPTPEGAAVSELLARCRRPPSLTRHAAAVSRRPPASH